MSLVKNRMSICNLVCVILLLAIVIIQLFVPYYTYTNTIKIDGKKTDVISQASYGQITWFPKEDAYEGLADHFKSNDMFGKIEKAYADRIEYVYTAEGKQTLNAKNLASL